MAGSNTLIETLAHLQQHVSGADSRRILLNYARKFAGARLGLLFRADMHARQLVLLEQCGQPPRRKHHIEKTRIDLAGLFGAALHHQGVLEVSDSHTDRRSLPEERSWTWRGGRAQLCAVATGSDISSARGVMVLCNGPKAATKSMSAQATGEMLICAALLGAYLEDAPDSMSEDERNRELSERDHKGQRPPHPTQPYPQPYPHLYLQPENDYDDGQIARILIGEMELLVDAGLDEQAFYAKILDYLMQKLPAAGGCLWLYQPSQGRFSLATNAGIDAPSLALAVDSLTEMAREQGRGARRGLRVVTVTPGYMLILHPLSFSGQLVGALAFIMQRADELPADWRTLFASMCDTAAIVLRSQQVRVEERQDAIDRERSRIARDIHDGAAQGIAHALHVLELAQRVLEKQPPVAQREIRRARETLLESLNDLRHDIVTLRPVQLEQANFAEAVHLLLDDFSKREPTIALHYAGAQLKHLSPSLEVPIFRLLQEALNNVQKHAHASQVSVQIQSLPGLVVAQVSDDGTGFDAERVRKGGPDAARIGSSARLGLRAMQERIEQAGGILDIASRSGAGTTIKARFPLAPSQAALTTREREVLRLLVDGSTNRAIADTLSVSIETVKSHVHHIMQKLQVKDRTQAAVLAARQKWV